MECPIQVTERPAASPRGYTTAGVQTGNDPRGGVEASAAVRLALGSGLVVGRRVARHEAMPGGIGLDDVVHAGVGQRALQPGG